MLLGLLLIGLSCQSNVAYIPPPLSTGFNLAGYYAITAIRISPAVQAGEDVMAMYADSSGSSPCLSDATIQFDPTGWVSFNKPAGCEQNNDLTEATGLHYGDRWSLQTNTLVVDDIGKTTQYDVAVDGEQITLSLAIDKGYKSSLDNNDPGFTLTIELKKI
ncbi:hypothetical protein GCM10028818_22960 [Spirosoma horti]